MHDDVTLHEVEGVPGLSFLDTGYLRPELAASYLLVQDGRAAFIETGTTRSVPRLLAALEARGLDRGDVDWVLVTHVHLDHAGGAGALMAELPNARLALHPRGARHMVDPEKLTKGAMAVYGEEAFVRNYEKLVPVPAGRVVETPDDTVLELAGRPLRFLDTPGHAYHHAAILDETSRGVFTGDIFGLSYREFDTGQGAFVLPTTTPIHFDPQAMHASIDRILALDPTVALMTHFGPVREVGRLGRDLHRRVDAYVDIARRHADEADRHARIAIDMEALLVDDLRAHGVTLPDSEIHDLLAMDIELNTQGLEVWLDKEAG